MKKVIQDTLKNGLLILDGATGTELQKRGLPSGVCPELWALENPELSGDISRSYREAGSDIVYACTFGGNPFKLSEYGITDVEGTNRRLAKLVRTFVDSDTLVAGDIGPSGKFIEPFGDTPFDDAVEAYARQAQGLKEGGVDLIVIETQIDLQEARAALQGVRKVWDGFVMITLTFESHGRTLNGTPPEAGLVALQSLGADAVGVNCSTGPVEMINVIQSMASLAEVPLVAKPNAGIPQLIDGKTVFPMGADEFASYAAGFTEAGANLLGGCCGTNPEHIVKLKAASSGLKSRSWVKANSLVICSSRGILNPGEGHVSKVGNRMNPFLNIDFKFAIESGDFESVMDLVWDQDDEGAEILEVSAIGCDDEAAVLTEIIRKCAPLASQPLMATVSTTAAAEAAMRLYPGRLLIHYVGSCLIKDLTSKYGSPMIKASSFNPENLIEYFTSLDKGGFYNISASGKSYAFLVA